MSEKQDSPPHSQDWLRVARKDWERIRHMLEKEDAEGAGFFIQQSLEKYLKAFLLSHGWNLRKIHELDALLDDAVKHKQELERFYDFCERVSGYYFAERYPPLGALELACKDIEQDIQEAKEFIKALFPDEHLCEVRVAHQSEPDAEKTDFNESPES